MSVIIPILAAVLLSVAAQILVKQGINSVSDLDFESGILSAYWKLLKSPLVLLGAMVYLLAVLLWLYSLSRADLSFAYPFIALSHVLIMIAAFFLLGEKLSALRLFGIAVICIGLVIISRS